MKTIKKYVLNTNLYLVSDFVDYMKDSFKKFTSSLVSYIDLKGPFILYSKNSICTLKLYILSDYIDFLIKY